MADPRSMTLDALRKGLAISPLDPGPAPARAVSTSLPEGDLAWSVYGHALARVRVDLRVAGDAEEARSVLAEMIQPLIADRGAKTVAVWRSGWPGGVDAPAWLADMGLTVVDGGDDCCRAWADTDLGVTCAVAGLAEPGSVVVAAGPGTERSASLVPPVHLALVPRSKLLPSALDLPAFIRSHRDANGGMPSAFHVISGPSSTSDIELTPVFGVHGPTTLMVLGLDFC